MYLNVPIGYLFFVHFNDIKCIHKCKMCYACTFLYIFKLYSFKKIFKNMKYQRHCTHCSSDIA